METLVVLLLFAVLTPFVLMLTGIALLFNSNESKRKKGRNLLLGGIILILIEVLIGYSVCSGMNFH